MGLRPSGPGGESDARLIALSLSRPEAFAEIFERHFTAIHAYLARRIGYSRADDLASATFTAAFERRRRFRGDADSARPWLFGIATNLFLATHYPSDWHSAHNISYVIANLIALKGSTP